MHLCLDQIYSIEYKTKTTWVKPKCRFFFFIYLGKMLSTSDWSCVQLVWSCVPDISVYDPAVWQGAVYASAALLRHDGDHSYQKSWLPHPPHLPAVPGPLPSAAQLQRLWPKNCEDKHVTVQYVTVQWYRKLNGSNVQSVLYHCGLCCSSYHCVCRRVPRHAVKVFAGMCWVLKMTGKLAKLKCF